MDPIGSVPTPTKATMERKGGGFDEDDDDDFLSVLRGLSDREEGQSSFTTRPFHSHSHAASSSSFLSSSPVAARGGRGRGGMSSPSSSSRRLADDFYFDVDADSSNEGERERERDTDEAHGNSELRVQEDAELKSRVEQLVLLKLDKKVDALHAAGRPSEALVLMDQALLSRVRAYGEGSGQVVAYIEQLALVQNSVAMAFLHKEQYSKCLHLLRKAEDLTAISSRLGAAQVQTLNNLACCYRRMGKVKKALTLLRQSLTILSHQDRLDARAVTHLNICAILSQLGRHQEALEHAKAAVLYCQKQLLAGKLKASLASEQDQNALLTEKIVVLGIAYHNLGVEEEFVGNLDSCLEWYYKALSLVRAHLGEDEDIAQTFKESYLNAKKAVQQQKKSASSTRLRGGVSTKKKNGDGGNRATSARSSTRGRASTSRRSNSTRVNLSASSSSSNSNSASRARIKRSLGFS